MLTADMKKIRLIIARSDLEIVMREIVHLECVEIIAPDELLKDSEICNLVKREIVTLDKFQTNYDNIILLGTRHTYLLTGWITARSEPELTARLSKYICAWEIESPEPDENVPVKLIWPKLFGFLYKGGGKPFNPLVSLIRN